MPSAMALRAALLLPGALSLRFSQQPPTVQMNKQCIHPKEDLAKSLTFTPAWWEDSSLARRPVSVEADGCELFHGAGIKCDMEAGEHYFVRKWIPKEATVIEFGARFGTTSCEIAKQLGNSGKLVSVEPDPRVWDDLASNLHSNNCRSHVIRGAVSKLPLHVQGGSYSTQTACVTGEEVANYFLADIEQALGRPVDTMLIDCEGCVTQMMDQILPALRSTVRTVILEKDGGVDYAEFFQTMEDLNFEQVEKVNDCDRATTGKREETWCGAGIWHYVWQKRAA